MTKKRRDLPAQSPETDLACQRIAALLVDYVAEDMALPTRTAFEAHLRNCPDCVAFFATYKETIRTTRSVYYEAIPAEMLARVQQFLRQQIAATPPQRETADGATEAEGDRL
ncbi:MAG TPA: zf-HC2 domain-containing protein [Candidatus Tectomicrobia bacterium]|jgi:anti-sigma factor RsiW